MSVRRHVRLVVMGLVSLALSMCAGGARLALAQERDPAIQQVVFYPASGIDRWNPAIDTVCMEGAVRGGIAVITGYSVRNACERRIGVAQRLADRACIEADCRRRWRLTFDAGGVVLVWAREPERRRGLRAELLDTRRWRIAFDPLRWT